MYRAWVAFPVAAPEVQAYEILVLPLRVPIEPEKAVSDLGPVSPLPMVVLQRIIIACLERLPGREVTGLLVGNVEEPLGLLLPRSLLRDSVAHAKTLK
jgi:hypothetical protein